MITSLSGSKLRVTTPTTLESWWIHTADRIVTSLIRKDSTAAGISFLWIKSLGFLLISSWSFLLDPFTYEYLNSSWSINGSPPRQYPGNHTTDITLQNSLGLLDEAVKAGGPFFLAVAPIGPHSNVHLSNPNVICLPGLASPGIATFSQPIPQAKYQNSFPGAQVPRTPDFNPNVVSGHHF